MVRDREGGREVSQRAFITRAFRNYILTYPPPDIPQANSSYPLLIPFSPSFMKPHSVRAT